MTTPFAIAVTGHRPPKIGGYDSTSPLRVAVRSHLHSALEYTTQEHYADTFIGPVICISGMALGVDQEFAALALMAGYHLHAYLPDTPQRHCDRWPALAQGHYRKLMERASRIHVAPATGTFRDRLLARNRMMMEAADHVIAVWDGSPGGTAHAVSIATSLGRPITRINPSEIHP